MKYCCFLFFSLTTLVSNAQEATLKERYYKKVSDFIAMIKDNDKEKIANHITYPFKRQYPIPDIKNPSEFLKKFDEIFDKKLRSRIIQSSITSDWSDMGWRGIMLFRGDVWLDYNGQLIAVNYQTEIENKKRNDLIKNDKDRLYTSLKKYEKPVCIFETSKYLIRIDNLGNQNFRYASWKRNSLMNSKPELVITKGKLLNDGSGGNHSYTFIAGNYSYECAIIVMGETGSPPATLTIYKDGKPIFSQKALKFKP